MGLHPSNVTKIRNGVRVNDNTNKECDINFLSTSGVHQNPREKFKTQGKLPVNRTIATVFQPDVERFIVLQEFARQPFIVLRSVGEP